MRGQQELESVLERARITVETRYAFNAGRPFDTQQCMCCGQKCSIKETQFEHHVFCEKACQRNLYGLDSFLRLGMKRGKVASVPETTITDLPYDVLGHLIAFAYGYELRSLDEMDELFDMRTTGQNFEAAIRLITIPAIRFLCGAILRAISSVALTGFNGLETLGVGKNRLGNGRRASSDDPLPVEALVYFPRMAKLTLREVDFSDSILTLSYMRNLQELHLFQVQMEDAQLGALSSLRTLSISDISTLTDACLAPLRNLTSLSLRMCSKFVDLNACTQLLELTLRVGCVVTDSGMEGLVNLTNLALTPDTYSDPMQDLKVTVACLKGKFKLTSLNLRKCNIIRNLRDLASDPIVQYLYENLVRLNIAERPCAFEMEEMMNFRSLVAIDVSNRDDMLIRPDTFMAFPQLTELFVDHLQCKAKQGWFPIQLPAGLLALSVKEISHKLLLQCPKLERLHLRNDQITLKSAKILKSLKVYEAWQSALNPSVMEELTNLQELILVNGPMREEDTTFLKAGAYFGTNHENSSRIIESLVSRGVFIFGNRSVVGIDRPPPHGRFSAYNYYAQ